jgi:hypothetical protein
MLSTAATHLYHAEHVLGAVATHLGHAAHVLGTASDPSIRRGRPAECRGACAQKAAVTISQTS